MRIVVEKDNPGTYLQHPFSPRKEKFESSLGAPPASFGSDSPEFFAVIVPSPRRWDNLTFTFPNASRASHCLSLVVSRSQRRGKICYVSRAACDCGAGRANRNDAQERPLVWSGRHCRLDGGIRGCAGQARAD